jgi:hypothetical protein
MMADEQNRNNWTRPELHHWAEREWEKFVTPDDLPGLKYWERGTELPLVDLTNHLRPFPVRMVQRFIHRFCLPVLDRFRPAFPIDGKPQMIPDKIVAALEADLGQAP